MQRATAFATASHGDLATSQSTRLIIDIVTLNGPRRRQIAHHDLGHSDLFKGVALGRVLGGLSVLTDRKSAKLRYCTGQIG